MKSFNQVSLTVLAMAFSLSVMAGTGSSGGGSGVVFKDGSVHLVDLLQGNVDSSTVATQEDVIQMFFKRNRYVKTIAEKNDQFYNCAIKKISQTNLVFKNQWIKSLSSVRVLNVEFPLIAQASKNILDAQPLPIFADSSESIASVNQVALASYSQGDLWVQKRFYLALSESDRCGLSIHEAIRHLNYTLLASKPLSTSEIEKITANLMDSSKEFAEQELIKNYSPPKSIEPVLALVRRIQDWTVQSMRSSVLSKNKMDELSEISLKLQNFEEVSLQGIVESHDLTKIAELLLDAAHSVNNYRFKYWDSQSAAERESLRTFSNQVLDNADDLFTASSMGIVSEFGTGIPNNFFDRLVTDDAITKKLRGIKKLDVLKMKIVN